ncbi:protein mono-ADP-ribosyltransferase PARP12 [Petromyzon marinus]|uniref:protein mono-ADP-ribosyltransferase PARP12 n=1 Tax=Petromyzon marinus TaxID=7757 RepID=UPI003F7175E2
MQSSYPQEGQQQQEKPPLPLDRALDTLHDSGCALPLSALASALGFPDLALLAALRSKPELFALVEGSSSSSLSGGQQQQQPERGSLDWRVLAVSALRVCPRYRERTGCPDGEGCAKLHVCRRFVLGSCKFGPDCKFSHDFRDGHNRDLCYKSGVEGLPFDPMQTLLLQNDPTLLPQICKTYKVLDAAGECKYGNKCARLHLCRPFVLGVCKFGDKCRRNHGLSDAGLRRLLKQHGVCAWPDAALLGLLRRREQIHAAAGGGADAADDGATIAPLGFAARAAARGRKAGGSGGDGWPAGAAGRDGEGEICLYHLLSKCHYKDRCLKSHAALPYRWQERSHGGGAWQDLPGTEAMERHYCDPASVSHDSVDFIHMKSVHGTVRRLSTANAVAMPDNFLLTTRWSWYWQECVGTWIKYGDEATTNDRAKSNVSSLDLEKAYHEDKEGSFKFTAGRFSYRLDFKDMMQTNLEVGTRRCVRRRPLLVTARDVEVARERHASLSRTGVGSVPAHWDRASLSDVDISLVELVNTTSEYKEVATLFKNTLSQPSINILNVKRVQNLELWDAFQRKREWMRKKNDGVEVEERKLFHGTRPKHVVPICQQNIDWRLRGAHGTAYGEGSYFARDASYSHTYSKGRKGTAPASAAMFLARVLVGRYTCGKAGYVRPPAIKASPSTSAGQPAPEVFYDSCVNTEIDPSIFVVFERDQIYPEYVIEYQF